MLFLLFLIKYWITWILSNEHLGHKEEVTSVQAGHFMETSMKVLKILKSFLRLLNSSPPKSMFEVLTYPNRVRLHHLVSCAQFRTFHQDKVITDEAQSVVRMWLRCVTQCVTRWGIWRQHMSAWTSPVAQMVKSLSAMWETWVQSLGWEDPLEKEMATHSSILAWRIPWIEGPGDLWSAELDMTERWTHNPM